MTAARCTECGEEAFRGYRNSHSKKIYLSPDAPWIIEHKPGCVERYPQASTIWQLIDQLSRPTLVYRFAYAMRHYQKGADVRMRNAEKEIVQIIERWMSGQASTLAAYRRLRDRGTDRRTDRVDEGEK